MSAVVTSLSPPDGWTDKTMIIHSAPIETGQAMAANVVVARDALLTNESFVEFCDRQEHVFRDSLPAYDGDERQSGRIGDRIATRIAFTWKSGSGPLRQEVVFIDVGSGIVVTFTASAAADDFEAHREVFDRQLAALRIDIAAND